MTDSPTGGTLPEPPRSGLDAGLGAEWPKKAADAVDLVVDTIHDRGIRPVMLAARAVVFGLLIAALGLVVLVLLSIGLLRLLDVYVFPGRVWASYALLGFVFSVVGLVAWSKRAPRGQVTGGD